MQNYISIVVDNHSYRNYNDYMLGDIRKLFTN